MKILVFSDSHHCLSYMYDAIAQEMPHRVFHLGDHISDAEDVSYAFDNLDLLYVPGNCDYAPDAAQSVLTEERGKRFFLTHGHNYGVKRTLDPLKAAGRDAGADVVLFGHTHVPYCEHTEDLWLMNPGSCSPRGRTYGVITLENGEIFCEIRKLD